MGSCLYQIENHADDRMEKASYLFICSKKNVGDGSGDILDFKKECLLLMFFDLLGLAIHMQSFWGF